MTDPILQRLHRGILEHPEDTGLRLIFADRLEDLGDDAHAKYIRWGCQPKLTRPIPRVSWRKWFRPWWDGKTCCHATQGRGRTPSNWVFRYRTSYTDPDTSMLVRHGFVEVIYITSMDLLRWAHELLDSHPIRNIYLTDTGNGAQPVLRDRLNAMRETRGLPPLETP